MPVNSNVEKLPLVVWIMPMGILLLSTPLWMQWVEPDLFLALNHGFAVVAAPVWLALSGLGDGWVQLALMAPLLVLAPRLLWTWLCVAPFAIVFSRVGKALIESPRPAAVIDPAQMHIIGEALHNVSMPSGHTLTAFAVASALYFALPVQRRLRYAWLWLLAAGTGLSRIAVGAHWPGDVAVGASLGIWAGLLAQCLHGRLEAKHFSPTHWSLRLLSLLLVFVLFELISVQRLLAGELDFSQKPMADWFLAAVVGVSLLAFVGQNLRAVFPTRQQK